MHRLLISGAAVAALAACQQKTETAQTGEAAQAAAAAPAPLAGPPARKPGLWVVSTSTMGRSQEIRTCIDAATDKEMSAWGQQASSSMCSKNSVTPTAGGWRFESVCDMGQGGVSTTTGTATGDFNASYVVKAQVVTAGSSMPQANGTHEMTLQARWEGPCPAGMNPGDMALPGGMKMTREMMRQAQGAAAGK